MSVKDYLVIVISLLALMISLIAARQKKFEIQRTVRGQITETIGKLIAVAAEIDKVSAELKNPNRQAHLDRLHKQNYSLARQADFLIQQLLYLVSDVECNIVAVAFGMANDSFKADYYWNKSIAVVSTNYKNDNQWYIAILKAKNIRGYANFLFQQGEYAEGRNQYLNAIKMLTFPYDQALWEKGWTYISWARNEAGLSCFEDAKRHLQVAEEIYKTIQNDVMREKALDLFGKVSDGIIRSSTPVFAKKTSRRRTKAVPSIDSSIWRVPADPHR